MAQDVRVKQYSQTKVQTADRGKLLLMVYDVAINSLKDSGRLMREGDHSEKGLRLDRALRAVGELRKSLDMEAGREIARSLDRLYDFMIRRIGEANLNNRPEHLEVVIRILEDLRETWTQVVNRHAGDIKPPDGDRPSGILA